MKKYNIVYADPAWTFSNRLRNGSPEANISAGIKDPIEYADAIMCLFDSAGRDGITALEIEQAYAKKVEINTKRIWVKNPDNTYSHVKVQNLKF